MGFPTDRGNSTRSIKGLKKTKFVKFVFLIRVKIHVLLSSKKNKSRKFCIEYAGYY